jgi:hypothetical protein
MRQFGDDPGGVIGNAMFDERIVKKHDMRIDMEIDLFGQVGVVLE